jgi:hypothetical protein
MNALPVSLASDLEDAGSAPRWLIEGLWADAAVGVLGGEPKCCKSFLALDVAVSVASGRPCLRSFAVRRAGPVLLFPAEDPLAVVRRRLEGIAAAAGTGLQGLPVHVITAPKLLLDNPDDRGRLARTVEAIRPVLLVLDPFIRLHRVDENAASEVAPLLGYLRELQRRFDLAVMLVHHARKDSRGARPGQALRGTSDLHGWGDSNLYLRRKGSGLRLSVEHRAAPARENIPIGLVERPSGPALCLVDADADDVPDARPDAAGRIIEALAGDARGASARELRRRCSMRSSTLCAELPALVAGGRLERTPDGLYRLPPGRVAVAASASLL